MAAVYRAACSPASLNTCRGGKKSQKRKRTGYKDSFTHSARDYFTSPPSSSPFSRSKNKYIRKKSRGNDSLMLLHKNPAASLPVVFLLWPEQTLFFCPSSREITAGKCFPSQTLRWLEIIYMKLIWKLLPSLSSAGYIQTMGESLGEVGSSCNLLSI